MWPLEVKSSNKTSRLLFFGRRFFFVKKYAKNCAEIFFVLKFPKIFWGEIWYGY